MAENLMTGKNTRRYMLINPDLYMDLTTRLKYATPPAVKHLVATDQEIDAILRDANLPLREKRRILSEALYRLQLYKSMIDSESIADSMVGPNAATSMVTGANRLAPYSSQAARRPWDTYRPVIQSSTPQRFDQPSMIPPHHFFAPTTSTTSARMPQQLQQQQQQQQQQISPSPLSASAFQRQLDDADGDEQQFATPHPAAAASSTASASASASADRNGKPITNMDAEILNFVPQNYQQQAFQFLKAIETLPDDVIKIDPNTLEVIVRGRPAIHIVDALKQISNTLPPPKGRATPMPMAGLQSVVGLMARRSNLPATIIRSPRIREYFVESRKAVTDQQQPSTSTSSYARAPRQRQQRGMPYDPTVFRNWHDVNQLPWKTTRKGTQF